MIAVLIYFSIHCDIPVFGKLQNEQQHFFNA